MGLFDRFKKKEEKPTKPVKPAEQRKSTISSRAFMAEDGHEYLEINFFNAQANFKDFYDSTRLIVRKDPTILPSGKAVHDAQVSWYSEHDAVMFDGSGRVNEMTNIKLGMDFGSLGSDGTYQKILMTQLLSKSRVESYIARGLQDDPEYPCGNYVGQVGLVQDKETKQWYWSKQFDENMGREVHYSPEQIVVRQQQKQREEQRRQAMIAENQRRMQQLQAEIDDLSK